MGKYVVVDLEMCRVNEKIKWNEIKFSTEIIQIGAVLLDEKYKITDIFSVYVSPEFGEVDSFITELTGITKKDTENAPCFQDALEEFAQWIPDDATIVTWSENDEIQLRKEMGVKKVENTKIKNLLADYIDCQYDFSKRMKSLRSYSLSEALYITAIDFEDGAHNALVDAHNTALLFAKLEQEETLHLSQYYHSENSHKGLCFNPFEELLSAF